MKHPSVPLSPPAPVTSSDSAQPSPLGQLKHWFLAKADAAYQRREFALARDFLEHSLIVDDRNVAAWIAFGSLHFSLGALEQARHAFLQARLLDGTQPRIFLHLALTHQKLGDWVEAENCFEQALRLAPYDSETIKLYSGMLMFRNRPQQARALLEHSLTSDLEDPELLVRLGVCCYQTGDFKAARACFRFALKLDPTSDLARENLEATNLHL